MECLPSKNFGHAGRLSIIILKYKELLEDKVIASLQFEGELKTTLCDTVRELIVTLELIKQEALCNEYINKIKVKIFEEDQQTRNVFSICARC